MIGSTAGTGVAFTEIQGNAVSKSFQNISEWISGIFSNEATSSQPITSTPLDPISPIIKTWEVVSGVSKTVFGSIASSYEWIKAEDNFQWITMFFKNFLNFEFIKNIVSNFHLSTRAWLGILFDKEVLINFPDAFKTFKVLSTFLSKAETSRGEDKDMINWLYLRLMVNPKRTINVLKRGQKNSQIGDESGLKCNGKNKKKSKKPKGDNLPLGICFICPSQNKLIDHMVNFLKKGIMPKEAKEK